MYRGDIRLGDTLDFKFTTRQFTTGAPFALSGGTLAAYPANSVTQITAGITLTPDFDGVVGLNHVRIVATGGNGYLTATDYEVVITAGTVDGVSVVGEVIGAFSIEHRSALMPTVAARTLDVTATGAAGIDWANIENPATAQNLSGTNIDPDQVVASVTGAVGSVTGNVGGNVVGSVGSIAAGGITAASIAAGALTAASFAAGAFDAVWTVATRTLTSFGTLVADIWANATRTLTSLAGNAADIRAAVGLAAANLDTQLGDLPTNAEFDARTLPAANYGTAANQATIIANQATINANVLTRATPAQVNTEVLDVLSVDTFAEPTGVPPATDTLANKIGRQHQALRNRIDVDANTGKKKFFDDAGVALWEKDFTDAANVYSETEGNAP